MKATTMLPYERQAYLNVLQQNFIKEERDRNVYYVYYHDEKYHLILSACTNLHLNFLAQNNCILIDAGEFEHLMLSGGDDDFAPIPYKALRPDEAVAEEALYTEPAAPAHQEAEQEIGGWGAVAEHVTEIESQAAPEIPADPVPQLSATLLDEQTVSSYLYRENAMPESMDVLLPEPAPSETLTVSPYLADTPAEHVSAYTPAESVAAPYFSAMASQPDVEPVAGVITDPVAAREASIIKREQAIQAREKAAIDWEDALEARERELEEKRAAYAARHGALAVREDDLIIMENDLAERRTWLLAKQQKFAVAKEDMRLLISDLA